MDSKVLLALFVVDLLFGIGEMDPLDSEPVPVEEEEEGDEEEVVAQ